MFKVIIAGGRDFNDYELLQKVCDYYLQNQKQIEIVSGNARGADKLGERYANEHNLQLKLFPANWDKFSKSAGYIRNEEMAKYGNGLIAFWNGKSKGTKHMIDLANQHNLKIRIKIY